MYWEVALTGDNAALRLLAEAFAGEDLSVSVREDGRHVIRACDFDELQHAGEVKAMADQFVVGLQGALALLTGSPSPLEAGAVYRVKDDGGRDIFVHPKAGAIRIKGMPVTLRVTKGDGTVAEQKPGDPAVEWLRAASSNPAAAKVLRLLAQERLRWSELYRLFEVIEHAVDGDLRNWVSRNEVRRFKRTANSVTAAGDEARHGKETTDPPTDPMSLDQARATVKALARGWLTSVAAGGESSSEPDAEDSED